MGIIKLGETTYYLSGRNNIGILLRGENRCWLVDSGGSDQEAEFILSQLAVRGWTLEGIAVTHYHADHTGGCAYLQEKTGCVICADPGTAGIAGAQDFNSAVLYGGYPPHGLRHGYYEARPYTASPLSALPAELTPFDLSGGHCLYMTGYRTPDGVAFVGDATINDQVLAADGLIYIYNPNRFLKILDTLEKELAACTVVPAHSRPTQDLSAFDAPVRRRVTDLVDFVFETCKEPTTRETLIKKTLDHFNCPSSLGKYATMSVAVLGALTCLLDEGRMEIRFDGNVQTCQSIVSFYAGLF